jgi:hypothetical protein
MMIPDPGMYLVEFKVPLPKQELQEHVDAGGAPPAEGAKIYWQGSTVVNIRGSKWK